MFARDMGGGAGANRRAEQRLGGEQENMAVERFGLCGAGRDAEAGVFWESRSFERFGEDDRFADPHEADGDAGSFPGGGVLQVDAGVNGAGGEPEFAVGQVGQANDSGPAEELRGGAFQVTGGELACDQESRVGSFAADPVEDIQNRGEALRFAQVSEHAEDAALGTDAERLAVAEGVAERSGGRKLEEVRDLDDIGVRGMGSDSFGGGGVVDDDDAGALGDALEHRPIEIARIGT